MTPASAEPTACNACVPVALDPDTMFSAGQGIADGFTYRAHEAKDFKPRSARVEINIKRIG